LSAALIWLSKTWITERLKNSIQHEYDVKLEAHRAALKAEYDKEVEIIKAKLKAESDIATERLRATLQQANAEHQVRYARLHEQVAETIAGTYSRLQRVHSAVANYTKVLEFANDPPKAERRKTVGVTFGDFQDYYRPRKLFVPRATARKIDAFETTLFKIAHEFMWAVEESEHTRQHDTTTWSKVSKQMSEDIPPLFSALEDDFQALLGMAPHAVQLPTTQ
jgi:hypothetical protein